MSNSDNNLLSFLKNQSLFSQSPTKRMSSRSREKSSGMGRNSPAKNQQVNPGGIGNYSPNINSNINPNINSNINSNINPNPNFVPNTIPSTTYTNPIPNFYPNQPTQSYYQNSNQSSGFNNKPPIQGQSSFQNNPPFQGSNTTSQFQGGNNTSYGNYSYEQQQTVNRTYEDSLSGTLTNNTEYYSDSYQSARMESLQRLERLSGKVKTQINILNSKMQMFGNEMMRMVNQSFSMTKDRIYQIVEETLRESESYLVQWKRQQEARFTEDINRAKRLLEEEINSIHAMSTDIKKPYWKNTAGVFITSEFEQRVESLIRQCDNIDVKKFDFQAEGHRLKDIERELINMVEKRLENFKITEFGR